MTPARDWNGYSPFFEPSDRSSLSGAPLGAVRISEAIQVFRQFDLNGFVSVVENSEEGDNQNFRGNAQTGCFLPCSREYALGQVDLSLWFG